MKHIFSSFTRGGIPVSPSMDTALAAAQVEQPAGGINTRRVLYLSVLTVANAAIISLIAKVLLLLINLITNISFHGRFCFLASNPQNEARGMGV